MASDGKRVIVVLGMLISALTTGAQPLHAKEATGDMVIERQVLGSTIRLETSTKFGGAVSSLVFRGKQYVDSLDHGRELQSASSFDGLGECFNPTEAGSVADGSGQTTSSKLLVAEVGPHWLATKTDMAFWLPPGFDYKHQCGTIPSVTRAVNNQIRGGHILNKHILVGLAGEPNVIVEQVTYTVPEAHGSATFEAATLYTPIDFSRRYVLSLATGEIRPTTITGEQDSPVILATSDGKHAVGLFSPFLPQGGLGYGTFGFSDTNKINCVFREGQVAANQKFKFLCEFAVGTLVEVKASILSLHERAMRDAPK